MNVLSQETSPYLLQHADNPVDWHPWGPEAFEIARRENKPVFLSIGYSTCHWCHVMAHESFENKEIAALMNESAINIKVDREEHPDIDAAYMSFIQSSTGQGGWPMSVWLTPDGEPITGGTYFPPEDRYGRSGFPRIIQQISTAWQQDREQIQVQASELLSQLQAHALSPSHSLEGSAQEVSQLFTTQALSYFDTAEGGFGQAPKFPRPALIDALLAHPDSPAREAALKTLSAMSRGGIHDQLGGGFHRYSVDTYWHIPHYEKMLYDQAQLITSYSEAWRQTEDPIYRETVEKTIDYLLANLLDETGAFHAAEDADSLPSHDSQTKKEGAYWVWTAKEIGQHLSPRDALIFSARFGIQAEGNTRPESDPHGELEGTNTLFIRDSIADIAATFDLPEPEICEILSKANATLLAVRGQRPAPHRDDKLITAWNALTAQALARAAFVFNRPDWGQIAKRTLQFIRQNLWAPDSGSLQRCYRPNNSPILAGPLDYAATIAACLSLDGIESSSQWRDWAVELQHSMDQLFWSKSASAYLTTAKVDGKALLSLVEDYDGAEPSPNNLAAQNLIQLSQLVPNSAFLSRAEALLLSSQNLADNPFAFPLRVTALRQLQEGPVHITWSGSFDEALIRKAVKICPSHALLTKTTRSSQVTICSNQRCSAPLSTAQDLDNWIEIATKSL